MLNTLQKKLIQLESVLFDKCHQQFLGYVLAVVLVVTAVAIRLAIAPQQVGLPFLTFFPTIILVALVCGWGPGLVAVISCTVLANYLFFEPIVPTPTSILACILFFLESLVILWLVESMFRLRHRYRFSAAKLEQSQRNELELKIASTVFDAYEGIMITDVKGSILKVNKAFIQLTGYNENELLGKNPRIFRSGHHDKEFFQNIFNIIKIKGQWKGEVWNKDKSGRVSPNFMTISAIKATDDSISHYVAMLIDISKIKEAQELTQKLAFFDLLTDLPNRSWFYDSFEYELNKSRRHHSPLALILLDIDQFKDINDEFGTHTGDSVLKEVAKRLLHSVRKTDTVARLGSDEFAVVLSGLNEISNAEHVIQTIVEAVTQSYYVGNNEHYQLSVRMGIAVYPNDATESVSMMACAEHALQAAKKELNANSYCFFTPSMQENAHNHLRLINDLRVALDRQEFEVYYQPIVELRTGKVDKAEALIRWKHPVRGMVSPAEFIPVAENTGLIDTIGDWVFRQSVKQMKEWRTTLNPCFQVSVNKSPMQFRSTHAFTIHKGWMDYLQTLGLPGDSVTLEITEGVLMNTNATSQQELVTLLDCGMQFAIDDFGTGYSSLAYLKKFDIDFLKIDQSFVKNLSEESADLALCEAIIMMAHKLGLKVIAEGIEIQQQLDLLLKAGCDYGQGYLFAKPMPATDFEKWRLPTSLSLLKDSV